MNDIEKTIEAVAEKSEETLELLDQPNKNLSGGTRRNRSRSQMLSVRVPSEDVAAIEKLSEAMDVPVSAIVRGFIHTALAEHRGTSTASDLVERLSADVQRLRKIVG